MDLNELKKLINEEVKRTRQRNLLKESQGATNRGFVGRKPMPKVSQGCPDGQIFDPDTGKCGPAPEMSDVDKLKSLTAEELKTRKKFLIDIININLQQFPSLSNYQVSFNDSGKQILQKYSSLINLSKSQDNNKQSIVLQKVINILSKLAMLERILNPENQSSSSELEKAISKLPVRQKMTSGGTIINKPQDMPTQNVPGISGGGLATEPTTIKRLVEKFKDKFFEEE